MNRSNLSSAERLTRAEQEAECTAVGAGRRPPLTFFAALAAFKAADLDCPPQPEIEKHTY